MANDTISDIEMEPAKIEFVQFHKPGLEAGDYSINLKQLVRTKDGKKIPEETFTAESKFTVAGERFALDPTLIHSVFPPEGSLGEHSNVLPHIILNRSTLPWERTVNKNHEDTPWLALLLFDADEAITPSIVKLGELLKPSPPNNKTKQPGINLQNGQREDDKVAIIDVQRELLENILPLINDLAWLAHVRQGKDDNGKVKGDELAIIIGNRLPRKGAISSAHLVSVEGRYDDKGAFNYQDAKPDDLIRLVSLKSWSFACVDKNQDFKGLLENLDPYNLDVGNRQRSVLRLPPQNTSPEAEKYLSIGSVLLPHFLRQGGKTVSWYHGPLTPADITNRLEISVRAADELLRYNSSNGIFDVSYAAAWELGRLLALQSKKMSISLYQWKRAHTQQEKQAEQRLLHPHLPEQGKKPNAVEIPKDVISWFNDLSLLKGVPFNYLVPDERMLPKESIRFFRLDQLWVGCLLDGAFSIGRVTTSNQALNKSLRETRVPNPNKKVSGCILRSDVVSGWSDLLVDAYDEPDKGGKRLEPICMDKLSAKILLCLFTGGEMKRVEVHQNPETLHFGFDVYEKAPYNFYKTVRDDKGNELQDEDKSIKVEIEDKLWQQKPQRSININQLAEAIRNNLKPSSSPEKFTSAQFALQMIEGVEKVIFQVQN
jgi:hypothetical protein